MRGDERMYRAYVKGAVHEAHQVKRQAELGMVGGLHLFWLSGETCKDCGEFP